MSKAMFARYLADRFRFYGVAPEATLYSYKVFANQFETDEETLIEAMLMAYDDGVRI